jgi:hypothetical protein
VQTQILRHFLVISALMLSLDLRAGNLTVCDESSLRAALAEGGTIKFGCDGTIVLASTLQVTSNTVLDGTGHNVVISGGDAVRVFFVSTNVSLSITNLTIAHGKVQGTNGVEGETVFGAGIFNDGGQVSLVGCNLRNNIAVGGDSSGNVRSGGDGSGGAIYNHSGLILIIDCILEENQCVGGAWYGPDGFMKMDGVGLGGAVSSVGGETTMINSEVRNNTVTGGTATGGTEHTFGSAMGGAIYANEGKISLNNNRFSGNRAIGTGGFGSGSGRAQGGSIYLTNSTAIISRCAFSTNGCWAGGVGRYGEVGIAQGGALYSAGNLSLVDSMFVENSSNGGNGSSGGGASQGGAIFNTASLVIDRCTIRGNSAIGGNGGGIVFTGYPGGDGRGGGIYSDNTFSATNTTIVSNVARGGLGGVGGVSNSLGKGGNGEGGGIFNLGQMTLTHLTIASNAAQPGFSKGPADEIETSNPGVGLGGGIYSNNSFTSLQNSIIAYSQSGSNAFGPLTDNGNNISSDASCMFAAPGSLNETDPLLDALADNGGLTPTMALLANSPAIDHGLGIYCPRSDQRGVMRPFGNGCDIGAFEVKTYPLNALSIESYTNRILHLVFTGTNGQQTRIQSSTNLVDWVGNGTNTVQANGTLDFYHTNQLIKGARFFRAVTP